jgi:O-glycosyl hydrolase
MDHFHKLLDLVDKNANTIPEGDYIEICNIIKYIHEKVKPPSFLLDQNEPMQMPTYEPTQMTPHEQAEFMEALHREWSEPST